jgi:RimJ/RimL family protein N-acetyltransferase
MIDAKSIRFRGAERQDIPRFVAWLNDPEVTEGLILYSPLSLAEEEEWFENLLKRPKDERPFVIEVQQGDAWVPIGNCGFHNIDWRCRSAEVGIFIGEKHLWGHGLGTEVMKKLIRYGFEILNLNRIMLDVYESNQRAIRSYEKAGFKLEGRKRQAMYKNGKYLDVLQMSVLREEWGE